MAETRKLAAIMAVDVVGYSRLMGEDEAGTARVIREHRNAARPLVSDRRGRIFKTMGDGLLAEFPSAVDAVECAAAIQRLMAERNAETLESKRIIYRIGVHLGDVLIEGDDIIGEGVNIAARLEGICEPGGVLISGSVHEQVRGRVEASFVDLGERELKNIRPVRAYRVVLNGSASADAPKLHVADTPRDRPSLAVLPFQNMRVRGKREDGKKRMTPLIGMIVCGVGFVGFAAWYLWPPQSSVQAIGAPPAPGPDPSAAQTRTEEAKKVAPVIAVDCRLATLPATVLTSGINTLDFIHMSDDGGPIGVGGTTSPPGSTLTWPTDRLGWPIMYCEFTTHDSRQLYSIQFNLNVSFHEVDKLPNGTIQNGILIKEREWPILITRINSNYSFGFYAFTTGNLMVSVKLPETAHYFDVETNQQLDARLLMVNWQVMSFASANAMKPISK
jgi:class 3 adenylate cyclase